MDRSQSPIYRLPAKFLIAIFYLVPASQAPCGIPFSTDASNWKSSIFHPLALLAVTHTCSHWRRIALSSIGLWITVVDDPASMWDMLIERSEGASKIHVSLSQLPSENIADPTISLPLDARKACSCNKSVLYSLHTRRFEELVTCWDIRDVR